jgi:transposase-like protein
MVMAGKKNPFKGRQFTAEIILWAVRWYLQFPISCRDLERRLADRGVHVDRTTLFRWIQAYAPELDKRIRPHLRMINGSWRVDETYIRIKGERVYLYRAVDAAEQTIEFLLSAKRDAAAASRFFRKALKHPHTVNSRTITIDKNAAYPIATKAMKRAGELWQFAKLRQVKLLTDVFDKPFSASVGAFSFWSAGLKQALSAWFPAEIGFERAIARREARRSTRATKARMVSAPAGEWIGRAGSAIVDGLG